MKTINFEVNGKEYVLNKMGAIQSLTLATKISKIAEPVISGQSSEDVNIAAILLGAMSNPEVPKIIQELTSGTGNKDNSPVYYDGMAVNFDKHYAEFPDDLLPVLAFSLRENVMSFFPPSALTTLIETLTGQEVD